MRWKVVNPAVVRVSLVADGLISAMLACAYLAPVAVVGPENDGPTTPRTVGSWMSLAAAAAVVGRNADDLELVLAGGVGLLDGEVEGVHLVDAELLVVAGQRALETDL